MNLVNKILECLKNRNLDIQNQLHKKHYVKPQLYKSQYVISGNGGKLRMLPNAEYVISVAIPNTNKIPENEGLYQE